MPLFDVIVREVVGVTYTIEAADKEAAENTYVEGERTRVEQWEAELVRVEPSRKWMRGTYQGYPALQFAYECGCYVVDCECGEVPPKCKAPWDIRYCTDHEQGFLSYRGTWVMNPAEARLPQRVNQ